VQQIGARISYNEIDLVMFFSDPIHPELAAPVNEIARLCDMHNVPFASNVATAEVLVQGLKRGDFAWRDIVNPKNRKK
jgi:methylglyoxal synthase